MEQNLTASAPAKAVYKRPSQAKEIWRRFRKRKGAVVGLICLGIILLAVLVGPLLIPYENATTQDFSNYLAKPSAEHLFGCDGYGRDILARVIHGGKTSLGIAILATIPSCIFGSLLGAVAGFFGGKVDAVILTGGAAHSRRLTGMIKDYAGFIGEIVIMPGEDELLALAKGVDRIMEGKENANVYGEE